MFDGGHEDDLLKSPCFNLIGNKFTKTEQDKCPVTITKSSQNWQSIDRKLFPGKRLIYLTSLNDFFYFSVKNLHIFGGTYSVFLNYKTILAMKLFKRHKIVWRAVASLRGKVPMKFDE